MCVLKKNIIFGLGQTGQSFARWLTKQKIHFEIADSRQYPKYLAYFRKNYPKVLLHLGPFSEVLYEGAQCFYLSPGIDPSEIFFQNAKKRGIKLINDIALFLQQIQAPVVAVTGTNGKSSVTAWVHHMGSFSKKNVLMGGNIGVPVLDLLPLPAETAVVLELSSFQLELAEDWPLLAACIINVTEDHLDRHDNFLNYQRIKQRIYQKARNLIFNASDPATQPPPEQIGAGVSSHAFSLASVSKGCPVTIQRSHKHGELSAQDSRSVMLKAYYGLDRIGGVSYLTRMHAPLIKTEDLYLSGSQNYLNALAAIALADCLLLEEDAILAGLKTFAGLPHRCQIISKKNSVTWINDSKATNVGAAVSAIRHCAQAYEGRLILVAGGQGKSANFRILVKVMFAHCERVFLYGEDAALILSVLKKEQASAPQHSTRCIVVPDLSEAIQSAHAYAKPLDCVLFSPACASFDMFVNFEERGRCFERMVLNLYA